MALNCWVYVHIIFYNITNKVFSFLPFVNVRLVIYYGEESHWRPLLVRNASIVSDKIFLILNFKIFYDEQSFKIKKHRSKIYENSWDMIKYYIFLLRNEVLTYKARYFSMFRLTRRTYTRGHVWWSSFCARLWIWEINLKVWWHFPWNEAVYMENAKSPVWCGSGDSYYWSTVDVCSFTWGT